MKYKEFELVSIVVTFRCPDTGKIVLDELVSNAVYYDTWNCETCGQHTDVTLSVEKCPSCGDSHRFRYIEVEGRTVIER